MTTKTLIKDILFTTSGVAAFTFLALSPVLAYAADGVGANAPGRIQSAEVKAELNGQFEGRSKHITSGDVSIVQTDAGYELVLADNFFLDGAPDPVIGFGDGDTYVKATTFTKLNKKAGRQNYALPDSFIPGANSQVFIWCEKFSVPLGVATLS